MSDHIPWEIQIQIMKGFPVRSLMRFRSVSKSWKSLIDSSDFVSDYNLRQTHPHIFIQYELPGDGGTKYASIVDDDDDDDNIPKHMFDLLAILPDSAKQMTRQLKLVGSSQGLLCLYHDSNNDSVAIILNPWIRKCVTVSFPKVNFTSDYGLVVGFGVCSKTSDPKLVLVTPKKSLLNETWKLEVYSLSWRFWRICSFSKVSDLLCGSLKLSSHSECVDGFIYWCASNKDDDLNPSWVIISFDLTNEEFGVIYLPDILKWYSILDLSKYRESLVLFANDCTSAKHVYEVWMMEGGVTKSFKKLFTINSTDYFSKPIAISYNGEAIMEMLESSTTENVNLASIKTYEPSSNRFKTTTISGICGLTCMSSYMETMLLRDYKVDVAAKLLGQENHSHYS
ncbi:putative F-box protein At4g09190 [Rutidosis leptorrhynchoides]|uniref:putative F-box protein At4g09190 n=1 Tax=Rutidosis leptorrhynchoides TaxID=125765 RepID=UPI003A99CE0E